MARAGLALAALAGLPALAAEPPLRYRLDAVTVTVRHQSGRIAAADRQLVLGGAGRATLTRAGATISFDYPAAALMDVLNALHHMRFFALPPDLTRRYSVFLQDDGMVGTSQRQSLDRPSTEVCARLADYEKCVRYAADGPAALVALVERLDADADRRAAAAP